MSNHLSVATVIEKNKIASDVAFIVLLDIAVVTANGEPLENVRLCRNTENIVYKGNSYQASHFTFDLKMDNESEPSLSIQADDATGLLREKMEEFSGGVGFAATLTIVNSGNLDQDPEIQEEFEVVGSAAEGHSVSFNLGAPNPLGARFPRRTQMRDQCPFVFKSAQCRYAGPSGSCDYTFSGANGCKSKNNQRNFGGFRGLQTLG